MTAAGDEAAGELVWWTLRRPFRPLTYDAARMVFTRVNQLLGPAFAVGTDGNGRLGGPLFPG